MAISQEYIEKQGSGLVIWLDQDGRGAGHLAFMLAARMAAEKGIAMTEAYRRLGYRDDRRSYLAVPHILRDLNVRSIRLLSNNPNKVSELAQYDVTVLRMIPIALDPEEHPEIRKSYADKAAQGHIAPVFQKGKE
jgi:GTP cyclohydrolase II